MFSISIITASIGCDGFFLPSIASESWNGTEHSLYRMAGKTPYRGTHSQATVLFGYMKVKLLLCVPKKVGVSRPPLNNPLTIAAL